MPALRSLSFLAVVAIALVACSDRQLEPPTAPQFNSAAAPARTTCSFTQLKKDVAATWPNSAGSSTKATNSAVSSILTTMQQNAADSNIATQRGFEILDTLAHSAAQQQPGVTASAGSQLALDLFLCMDVPALPGTLTFVPALGPNGAFAVRGTVSADARPVVTHDGGWAIAPTGASSWQAVTLRSGSAGSQLLTETTKKLFLAYAQPGSTNGFTGTGDQLLNGNTNPNNTVIDWATQPGQTFSPTPVGTTPLDPGVAVSQCPSATGLYKQGFVQHNPAGAPNAEILSFFSPTCPFPKTYIGGDGQGYYARLQQQPRSLMGSVLQFFAPELAYAAGGGSGTKTTALSPWGVIFPGDVNLTNPQWPSKSGNTINVAFSPEITAAALSNGGVPFKQPTVFAWLEATNNQGVNVLVCNNWAFTEPNGALEFKNAFLNKAGGYTLSMKTVGTNVSNSASDTPPVPAGPPISSPLFNVKNAGTTSGSGCTPIPGPTGTTQTGGVYIDGTSGIPPAPSGPPSDANPYWANGTLTQ